MDPRTYDLTGPRPHNEIQIIIELPSRFTLEQDALATMVGGHITVKHQPSGQQCDAICQSVTYHKAGHAITVRLELPGHDYPHHGWTLATPPTYTLAPAPHELRPPPTRLTLNDIDLTPYVRFAPEPHIDQNPYPTRPTP